MASGSALPAPFGHPVTEKLTKSNFTLRKVKILPAIRGAQLEGFLNGSMLAPVKEINVKVGDKDIKQPNPEVVSHGLVGIHLPRYIIIT